MGMIPLDAAWCVLKEDYNPNPAQADNDMSFEEYQKLSREEKSKIFAQWYRQNIARKPATADAPAERAWQRVQAGPQSLSGGEMPTEGEFVGE